ncbi:hypothetical protein ACLOJK_024559 [Asimina triloba]
MAAEGLSRCIFEGAIVGHDSSIDKRPYHCKCGCALHAKLGGCCKDQAEQISVADFITGIVLAILFLFNYYRSDTEHGEPRTSSMI